MAVIFGLRGRGEVRSSASWSSVRIRHVLAKHHGAVHVRTVGSRGSFSSLGAGKNRWRSCVWWAGPRRSAAREVVTNAGTTLLLLRSNCRVTHSLGLTQATRWILPWLRRARGGYLHTTCFVGVPQASTASNWNTRAEMRVAHLLPKR